MDGSESTYLHVVTCICHQLICCANRSTVPLTSNLTALVCRTRVARKYSHTHTHVLARVHASTRTRTRVYSREYTRVFENARAHARTRERDSRAVDTLASYPSPPLSFGVGEAWV